MNRLAINAGIAGAMITAWNARYPGKFDAWDGLVLDWKIACGLNALHYGGGWGTKNPDDNIHHAVNLLLYDLFSAGLLLRHVKPSLNRYNLNPHDDYYIPIARRDDCRNCSGFLTYDEECALPDVVRVTKRRMALGK